MNSNRNPSVIRLMLGFLMAPPVMPISAALLNIIASDIRNGDCPAGYFLMLMIYWGVPMSYVFALALGLPYVLLLRKMGQLNFGAVVAPVLGLGLLVFGVLFVVGLLTPLSLPVTITVPSGAILSALCFYFISVWRPVQSCGS